MGNGDWQVFEKFIQLIMTYQYFKLDINNYIANVAFNIPKKANSLNVAAWQEMEQIFGQLHEDNNVRVIILSGEGKHFCSGIDVMALMEMQQGLDNSCEARNREKIRAFVLMLQRTITSIEKCRKPVLAAVHGACIGGGVDIISACDMRYCTEDAYFTIKEIDLGIVADIGTLQRLPKIIHPGIMAELAYTGRKVYGPEAEKIGLVNTAYTDRNALMMGIGDLATMIATKSPLCIRGIKENLLYQRDHTVADSLDYVATWNSAMLLSNDIKEAMMAFFEKREAVFKD